MAIKSGVLLLLFLASVSLSLAFSPQQKLDQCLQVCQSRYPAPQVTLSCMGRCADDYYKQIKPQSQNQQDQDFSSPPEEVEFECQKQCQFEPRDRQRQCRMKCEQGQEDESYSPRPSRLERLRSCQRRCSDLSIFQQLPCQTRCATEFGFRGQYDNAVMNPEESEDTPPQKESEDTSSSKPSGKEEWEETSSSKPSKEDTPTRPSRFPQPPREREVEQCQKRCQFQPKWQQGQCFRRCESGQGQSKWDRYEQCQRRCAQMGPFYQIPCHTKCTADFGFGIAGLSDFY